MVVLAKHNMEIGHLGYSVDDLVLCVDSERLLISHHVEMQSRKNGQVGSARVHAPVPENTDSDSSRLKKIHVVKK